MPITKDYDLIWEAYNKKDPIKEGIWDRAKAKGSSIAKGAGQLGKNIGGISKAAGQAIMGKSPEAMNTLKALKPVKGASLDAKATSLISSHIAKIEKDIADFQNDIKKLNLGPQGMQGASPEVAKGMLEIQQSIGRLKNTISRTQNPQPTVKPVSKPTNVESKNNNIPPLKRITNDSLSKIDHKKFKNITPLKRINNDSLSKIDHKKFKNITPLKRFKFND